MNKTVKRNVGNAFIYVILIAVSITMLFPFLWMISTSLKSKMDAQVFPPQWIPNPSLLKELRSKMHTIAGGVTA